MALLGVVSLAICRTLFLCSSKALRFGKRDSGGQLLGTEGPFLRASVYFSFVSNCFGPGCIAIDWVACWIGLKVRVGRPLMGQPLWYSTEWFFPSCQTHDGEQAP